MNEELEVEDILSSLIPKKKKRINTGRKGKGGERDVCEWFNERFAELLKKNPKLGGFSRSIGSGNRWGQKVNLSQAAKDTFSGDISVPTYFSFVLESKKGYCDIDLNSAFDGGHKEIDKWMAQVSNESSRCGRPPMIIWKKNFKPRLCMLRDPTPTIGTYCMKYRDWTIYLLDDIFKLDDEFFFDIPTD